MPKNRDIFAGMIGALHRRIIAVIGSEGESVARFQRLEDCGERVVEFPEAPGKTYWIVPVSVEHVEVDEIHKEQPVVEAGGFFDDMIDPLRVARLVNSSRKPATGEQIFDLADSYGGNPRPGDYIEDRVPFRHQREILPVRSPLKRPRGPGKGTRDDPSYRMPADADMLARCPAHRVKTVERKDILVGCNLEH